ncbi:NAD(P)/FAD-dependent oxidoreductase [Actinotalea ferrariae]|uniref:NAD(P)/FAD-dependent oxidoreductase n=1 Tax=Actinotalea ferrariae TaxID=1386098 RepID=UPI001C8BB5AD|nr:NAD(P)/FAD-dependent oxidoreductase [Actinotalea ferrariae]MBX9244221.1 NAD(P)/FAD-dependent oxidoreductase [Actinotalea ferrariae]
MRSDPPPTGVDVVVVGGGPAGLSAALVLGRSRRSVLVVDDGRPRNAVAHHVSGFLTRDGTPPDELLRIAAEEVERYGVELRRARAEALVPRPDVTPAAAGVDVELDDGTRVRARRVVLATGLRDELPEVPGIADRWGRDVLHCPYCDGWETRDRRVGVLAGRADEVGKALSMTRWTSDVVLLLHGMERDEIHPTDRARLDALGVRVVDGPVVGVEVVDDALAAVRTAEQRVELEALLVQPRLVASDALVTAVGARVEVGPFGHVLVTDPEGRTSVPHVWAAGNVSDPMSQVVMAAAAGYRTALAVDHDLIEEDVDDAVARRAGSPGRDDAPDDPLGSGPPGA